MRLQSDLSERLREAADRLRPLESCSPIAARALDRLERDLLPRTAGTASYLVAGLVGPNNAGKSALFNSLIGRGLSPSIASGGATRRLVGATHPELLEALLAEPSLSRFRLRALPEEQAGQQALLHAADPAELLVARESMLPRSLMLIDAPDFDSIFRENRAASEALLAVTDLAIAIVTRHSYQNQEVIDFLQTWFQHGKPWVLVYNEAPDRETALSHTAKVIADVGRDPQAVFWAPHALGVARGTLPLRPRELRSAASPVTEERTLQQFLFDLKEVDQVKASALAASLQALRAELQQAAREVAVESEQGRALLAAIRPRCDALARRIAAEAMPAAPLIEAYQAVLQRRSNRLTRSWRGAVHQLNHKLKHLPNLIRRKQDSLEPAEIEARNLSKAEIEAWKRCAGGFWEQLVRDFGPEARAAVRKTAGANWCQRLDADLATRSFEQARTEFETALARTPADRERFREICEELIEEVIDARGFQWDLQAAADLTALAPLAIATGIIIKTGGLGSDVAVAGGGATGTFLANKFFGWLGRDTQKRATERWAASRGEALSQALLSAAFPRSAEALQQSEQNEHDTAERLRQLAQSLA